jgi:hypothetical protein
MRERDQEPRRGTVAEAWSPRILAFGAGGSLEPQTLHSSLGNIENPISKTNRDWGVAQVLEGMMTGR